MGGKGKKSITILAKRQEREQKLAQQKKEVKKPVEKKEKTEISIISKETLEAIKKEILNSNYSSAWSIASKFGIKMGEAKRILASFAKEGIIKYAYKSSRNPIFTKVS